MQKLKNIFLVAFSNSTSILAGVFIGFLIPKLLTVNGYGMYKTFTLYMTYVGFFSLGIIDGIVLKYGGVDYQDINRKKFRSYFLWYNLVHLLFFVVLLLFALLSKNDSNKFIFISLSINMWAINLTGYYQQISQITQRFKEFSLRKILSNILNILIVIGLYYYHFFGYEIDYTLYILLILLINIILTVWYLFTYRDISFGDKESLLNTKGDIIDLILNGFPLLFANLLSTLILTLDRQFVNLLFDKEVYAVYAFAYNMLAIVTVATSAFSVVLYPSLKRTTVDKLEKNYKFFIQIIIILVSVALLVYFPLCKIVTEFLPNYTDSLPIFRVVFPGLIISSAITVVMHNYYKTLGKNIIFFKRSILVLLLSALANFIAYFLFKTTISISIASIIVMIFWYMYIDSYFNKIYHTSNFINLLYIIMMMISFYLATSINVLLIGGLVYIILVLFITVLFYKNNFKIYIDIIR